MNIKKITILFLTATMLTGCGKSIKYNFPEDIKYQCHGAKNEAKAKLESVGLSIKEKNDCTVLKVKGQKKINGIWAWYDTTWKMYVAGLCDGKNVWIGVNPQTGDEIWIAGLVHEFGHFWLISNYNDWGHNPQYAHLFVNWADPRHTLFHASNIEDKNIKKHYESMDYGDVISVLYSPDNFVEKMYIYKFIKEQ
jgi:hypothetical protein